MHITFPRLVGGLEHESNFSIYWEESSSQLTYTPSFFRGVGIPTTNQLPWFLSVPLGYYAAMILAMDTWQTPYHSHQYHRVPSSGVDDSDPLALFYGNHET